jgi:hypothetical protein
MVWTTSNAAGGLILCHPFVTVDLKGKRLLRAGGAISERVPLLIAASRGHYLKGTLVHEAARGIILEGALQGDAAVAAGERMAQELEEVAHGLCEDIFLCAISLYTEESFLYRACNATMRTVPRHLSEVLAQSPLRFFIAILQWALIWHPKFGSVYGRDAIVYRGCVQPRPAVGEVLTMRGFTSFSLDEPKAAAFSAHALLKEGMERIVFCVKLPRTKRTDRIGGLWFGCAVRPGGGVADEDAEGEEEVIVLDGMRLIVQSVEVGSDEPFDPNAYGGRYPEPLTKVVAIVDEEHTKAYFRMVTEMS